MEVELTSDTVALDRFAGDAALPNNGEDAARRAQAACEGRERRRIEFRSSLMNARASMAPVKGRETVHQSVKQSMRQLSAEMRERRPARMMAELANAH